MTVSTHHHTVDPQLSSEGVDNEEDLVDGDEEIEIQYDEQGNIYDIEGNHIPGLAMTAEGQIVKVGENGELLGEEEGEEQQVEVYVDENGEVITDEEGNPIEVQEEGAEEAVILFDREALYEDFKQGLDTDLGSLLDGDALTEEQKQQIRTVFEAAVLARVDQMADVLEEAFMSTLSESVEEVKSQLAEKTEDYLSYVAEEWMKNNELAVEQGLRTELAEDFIKGMKDLFVEHYIEIPDDKVNVLEELSEEVAQAESKLNEQIQKNVELSKQVRAYQAGDVFATVCEDLTDVQVDKMRSLAEGIEFTTADEFKSKLTLLKTNYFSGAAPAASTTTKKVDGGLNEAVEIEDDKTVKSHDPTVNAFKTALDRASQYK